MKKIFEKLEIVDNDEGLQKIQKKYNRYDEMYLKQAVSIREGSFRGRVEKMYLMSKEYLDKDFTEVCKIKGNFNTRLRELYLISLLLERRYNLDQKKPKKKSPDIKLDFGGKNIRIECVASTKGEGKNEIHDMMNGYNGPIDAVDIPRKLRLIQAMDVKMKKFNCYILDKIIGENDCCVIALNGGESDGDRINNGLGSILFGYGKTIYYNNHGKLKGPFVEDRKEVRNKNDSIVDSALFLSRYYNHISGVVYLGSSVVNCQNYQLNGKISLEFIRNPNAKNQIPEDFLKEFEVI